jgi:hypothetical protein
MPSAGRGCFPQGWGTQDSHSAFDEEERFDPEVGAVAENADEDGNCDWKYHEQPNVVEDSDQFLVGHV